jgi:hypothetical protein
MKKLEAIFLFMLLMGCMTNQIASPTMAPENIHTSSLTSTQTPISPAQTFTPSPTLIPTITFTSTPITPIPTLSPNEQETYLLNLIQTNGGCQLPCFLGLQPGISTWDEIKNVEGPIHSRDKYAPDTKGSTYLYTFIEKRIESFDVTLWGSDKVIEKVTVYVGMYSTSRSSYKANLAKAMESYALPSILSQYGKPSRILLQAQGQIEPYSGTQAQILLFYDHLGFVIHYFFINIVFQDDNSYVLHICPNYDYTELIKLYLQSADNSTSLEDMIDDKDSYYLRSYLQPLEEITNLNVDEFYNLFNGTNKTVCFDVQ